MSAGRYSFIIASMIGLSLPLSAHAQAIVVKPNVIDAGKHLRQVEEQYQKGIGTTTDVTQAMTALVEARYMAANALLAPRTGNAAVVNAKEQLSRVEAGYQAKKNTSAEVDQAMIAVLDACNRQATVSQKDTPDSVLQSLELADAKQGDQFRLAALNYQTGKETIAKVTEANAARNDAHSRLCLYQSVILAQHYVNTVRAAHKGEAASKEIKRAMAVLQDAQARQAAFSADPGPATLAANVSAAQEQLRLTEAGYQNGTNTIADLDKAQADLEKARTAAGLSANVITSH